MNATSFKYMPILKWRLGEYQALLRLKGETKSSVLPLIVIPPVEFDFEDQRPKKSVSEHIEPFPKRFATKWGDSKALIDLHESLHSTEISDSCLVIEYIFNELRNNSEDHNAVPVLRLNMTKEFYDAAKKIISTDQKGLDCE